MVEDLYFCKKTAPNAYKRCLFLKLKKIIAPDLKNVIPEDRSFYVDIMPQQ